MSRTTLALAIAVATLALAACGEDPVARLATPIPTGSEAVEVTVSEYEIDMPDTIPAGAIAFEITNDGDIDHGFVVTGNGVDEQLAQPVAPGDSKPLPVELEPGTYTIFCPIGDHRTEGMERTIEVTDEG